ncbi:MAG: hypothetical protein V1754_07200 [Pseudomonadota bacterium]
MGVRVPLLALLRPGSKSSGQKSPIYPIAVFGSLAVVFLLCFFPVQSCDIFIYLELARRFFADLSFPATDPFLFSTTNPGWHVFHEWAAYVSYYTFYLAAGWAGIIFFKTAIILSTFSLPYILHRKKAAQSLFVPVFVTALAFAASFRFVERSSLFSDALLALVFFFILFAKDKPRSKTLFFIPLVFLFWVNFHPGFHLGLAVLFFWILSEFAKRLFSKEARQLDKNVLVQISIFVFSTLACFVNPAGIRGFWYPFSLIGNEKWDLYRKYNFEWMSPFDARYVHTPGIIFFFLLLTVLGILLLFALFKTWRNKRSELPIFELLVFVLLAYLGLSAVRFVTTASFSMAICFVSLMGKLDISPRKSAKAVPRISKRIFGTIVLVGLLFTILKLLFGGYDSLAGPRHLASGMDENHNPVKAAEFIDSVGLNVNIFNQHEFGAYLIWKWHGKRKLYYHGFVVDFDFYENDYLGANESRRNFDRIVNEYNIGAFLLTTMPFTPTQGPLLYRILLLDPNWQLVYAGRTAMIFVRDIPENRHIIERYANPNTQGLRLIPHEQ